MGLAATIHLFTKSVTSAEGGIDQMKRATALINEMRTFIPDFNKHSAVYTQLAKYLTRDDMISYLQGKQESDKEGYKQNDISDAKNALSEEQSQLLDEYLKGLIQQPQSRPPSRPPRPGNTPPPPPH